MPRTLSEAELEKLRKLHSRYDLDCDGVLDRSEFSILLKSLEPQLTREEVAECLNAIDDDRSGTIDFDEFVAWWSNR